MPRKKSLKPPGVETLRQAKAAYRKSSGRPKLSARDIACMEREKTLEERADKIKKSEARKKENARKREEKKAKDRELARRMGRDLPVEGGFKVGASQLPLARFLPGKIGEDDERSGPEEMDENSNLVIVSEEQLPDSAKDKPPARSQNTILMPPPPRPPLKSITANTVKKNVPAPSQTKRPIIQDDFTDFFVSNTQIERELSPSLSLQQSMPKVGIDFAKASTILEKKYETENFLAGISTQDLDFCPLTQVTIPHALESNTCAVQHDLSTTPTQSRSPTPPTPEDANLLLDISTQDLDFSDLTQPELKPSSQSPTNAEQRTKAEASTSFGFGDDISDGDFEALAEEVELQSSTSSSKHHTPTPASLFKIPVKSTSKPVFLQTPVANAKETPLSELKLSNMDIAMLAMQPGFGEADNDEPWDNSISTDDEFSNSFG